ncbi:hypothetical protein CMV16_13745 [Peribacillus simplex]|nr:hypothetical protein CMV16_13745 [Peribacillus simplex]
MLIIQKVNLTKKEGKELFKKNPSSFREKRNSHFSQKEKSLKRFSAPGSFFSFWSSCKFETKFDQNTL